jgi:hypothetical protein
LARLSLLEYGIGCGSLGECPVSYNQPSCPVYFH